MSVSGYAVIRPSDPHAKRISALTLLNVLNSLTQY